MKYGIGQKLTLTEDLGVKKFFKEEKEIIKAGTKMFVTASKECPRAIYKNEDVQLLQKDTKIEGYSAKGIAEWIYEYISKNLPLDDALEDYDIEIEQFKQVIVNALEQLDFYNSEGNIS
jgi:hypothetical protein